MSTPLYKTLKTNGTTIYAFPGAEEDINQKSENYKVYFDKFVLLNLPARQIELDAPQTWDFEKFYSASNQSISSFGASVVNSIRNYVANQEVVMKNSKTSNNEYFYDNSILQTNTEKIFYKWCKDLNLIQFEPAVDGDEYFGDLPDFESNSINDSSYLPEFLWKEREVSADNILNFNNNGSNFLEVEYEGTINYKVGDFIEFKDVSNSNFPTIVKYAKVTAITQPTSTDGYKVVYNIPYSASIQIENDGYSSLVYNKLIRYIGEIQGNNRITAQNLSLEQIMAFIPDDAGQTPDILFRTKADSNYAPGLKFPILPSQYQPEIIGAENFNSPIVRNPSNYDGDQYAQYDNYDNLDEYTYILRSGDSLRRTGDYYGTTGDINNINFNAENIDGIQVDFEPSHYVKMNLVNQTSSNFDDFNTKQINGEFPSDFDFNAILWYYKVEDINGNTSTNLYGISFLDNPENDPVQIGERFPVYKKIAATNDQDGTAYQFSLNRRTSIVPDQTQPQFSNDNVHNLFGFNLFNEAMRRLVYFNESASKIISENKVLSEKINDLRQLIYTQTSLDTINARIDVLNNLLRLYSTNQIVSTDSILVETDTTVSPPEIKLYNIEGRYGEINLIDTTTLYSINNVIPGIISVPSGKDFLIEVTNNDRLYSPLSDNLSIILDRDLDYKQTVDIKIDGDEFASQNKKLDIGIFYNDNINAPVILNFEENIDLPVYVNTTNQQKNAAYKWKNIKQDITEITLNSNGNSVDLTVPRTSGLQVGDTIVLDNILLSTTPEISLDGQYTIDSIGTYSISIDYTQYSEMNTYITDSIANNTLSNGDVITDYYTMGSFRLNKGMILSITRVDELNTSTFKERYSINYKYI